MPAGAVDTPHQQQLPAFIPPNVTSNPHKTLLDQQLQQGSRGVNNLNHDAKSKAQNTAHPSAARKSRGPAVSAASHSNVSRSHSAPPPDSSSTSTTNLVASTGPKKRGRPRTQRAPYKEHQFPEEDCPCPTLFSSREDFFEHWRPKHFGLWLRAGFVYCPIVGCHHSNMWDGEPGLPGSGCEGGFYVIGPYKSRRELKLHLENWHEGCVRD